MRLPASVVSEEDKGFQLSLGGGITAFAPRPPAGLRIGEVTESVIALTGTTVLT